jgi:hypothetical protein
MAAGACVGSPLVSSCRTLLTAAALFGHIASTSAWRQTKTDIAFVKHVYLEAKAEKEGRRLLSSGRGEEGNSRNSYAGLSHTWAACSVAVFSNELSVFHGYHLTYMLLTSPISSYFSGYKHSVPGKKTTMKGNRLS